MKRNKMEKSKIELIERYLYAVTHKLPGQMRMDVEKELRGLIEDMLDERVHGETATQREVEEVLTELGNPSELAAKYRGYKKYLIGPEMFDMYMVVLKVVVISIIATLSVIFAIEIIITPFNILNHFIDYIVSLITGSMQGFTWVTFVFWLIEYAGVKCVKFGSKSEWSPEQLPVIPDLKVQIKPMEPIIGIII